MKKKAVTQAQKDFMKNVVNPKIDASATHLIYNHYLPNELTLDRDREMWYAIKENKDIIQYEEEYDRTREGSFEDAANARVSKVIENIAFTTDPLIYSKLGLHESIEMARGSVPVILVLEKKKSIFQELAYKYSASIFYSKGQVGTRACAYFAEYIVETGFKKGQILMITDYDAAGESMVKQVRRKMNLFKASGIEIDVAWMWDGADLFAGGITPYELTNKTNKSWIKKGFTQGIEFNSPSNVGYAYARAEEELKKMIDPNLYGVLAHESWKSNLYLKMKRKNKKYQRNLTKYYKIQDKLLEIRAKIESKIDRLSPKFTRGDPLGYGCIIPKDGKTVTYPQGEEELKWILGENNPY